MPRSFLRARLPGGKRRAPGTPEQPPVPSSPVPLPIGGHRSGTTPQPSGTGPPTLAQMQSWSRVRPSGAPRGSLIGEARGRPRSDSTPPPVPTGSYAYVSDESFEAETQDDPYQNDPGPLTPEHTHPARDTVETGSYTYVSDEAFEAETDDDPYQNDLGPLTPEHAPSPVVQQIHQEAAQVAQPAAPGAQPATRPGKLPKPPDDVPAVREHRAWLVKHLLNLYDKEEEQQSQHLLDEVTNLGQAVAKYYRILGVMRALSPNDQQGLAALVRQFPPDSPTARATSYAETLECAEAHYARVLEKARREELPIAEDGTVGDISTRFVQYDKTPEAQGRTAVKVAGGRLFRADGSTPVNTADSVTHHTGLGAEIFVVGERNDIHMASHKIGKFHHSSLLAGKPVSMAGEMQVTDGTIDWLSNKSGHYAPTLVQLQQFLRHLEKDRVPLDFPVRSMSRIPDLPAGATARQVLDGINVHGIADDDLSLESVKTRTLLPEWVRAIGKPAVKKVVRDHGWILDESLGELEVTFPDGSLVDGRTVRKALKAAHPNTTVRAELGQRSPRSVP